MVEFTLTPIHGNKVLLVEEPFELLGSDFLDHRLGLPLPAGRAAGRGRLLSFRPCGGVNVTQKDRDQCQDAQKDDCFRMVHRRRHRRAAGRSTPPSSSPAPPPSAEPYRRTVVRCRHRRTDCRTPAIFEFSDSVSYTGRTALGTTKSEMMTMTTTTMIKMTSPWCIYLVFHCTVKSEPVTHAGVLMCHTLKMCE